MGVCLPGGHHDAVFLWRDDLDRPGQLQRQLLLRHWQEGCRSAADDAGGQLPGECLGPARQAIPPPPIIQSAKELQRQITNSIGMKFILIPAGTFRMGSPDGEKDRSLDEGPVHEVQIARAFYLGVTPVTQEQYEGLMGT